MSGAVGDETMMKAEELAFVSTFTSLISPRVLLFSFPLPSCCSPISPYHPSSSFLFLPLPSSSFHFTPSLALALASKPPSSRPHFHPLPFLTWSTQYANNRGRWETYLSSTPPNFLTIFLRLKTVPKTSFASSSALRTRAWGAVFGRGTAEVGVGSHFFL